VDAFFARRSGQTAVIQDFIQKFLTKIAVAKRKEREKLLTKPTKQGKSGVCVVFAAEHFSFQGGYLRFAGEFSMCFLCCGGSLWLQN